MINFKDKNKKKMIYKNSDLFIMFYQICFQLIEEASTNIFILIFTFVLIPRNKNFRIY